MKTKVEVKRRWQFVIYDFHSKSKRIVFSTKCKTKPVTKARCFQLIRKEMKGKKNCCYEMEAL
jgi:hypothetical protein